MLVTKSPGGNGNVGSNYHSTVLVGLLSSVTADQYNVT